MSRISRYQDSFRKFIKERSAIANINDSQVKNMFNKYHKNGDYSLPILLLTILNSQNKKNDISFHAYPVASAIEYLLVIINILNNEEINYENFRICSVLNSLVSKAFAENIIAVRRKLPSDKVNSITIEMLKTLEIKSGINGLFKNIEIKTNPKIKSDLISYLKKNDNELYKKFISLSPLQQETIDEIIDNQYGAISQLAVNLAWIIGCGNDKDKKRLTKLGLAFGRMLKLSNDFKNLDKDISQAKKYTFNYIANCGFTKSYNLFTNSKQQFIEECMNMDILSTTVKEILDIIEKNVVDIIDDTSPDLKSTCSSLTLIDL
ncbi:MAG: hypothetical protein CMF62_02125 [Magnetococcales bacterium]|nr:hypothetical protein [Magnetococcales bacterium]|tara:strand:+ start:162560 stop:163519 length:960 start_codon:yes stop_codon:yes gene_type:complete